jgi:hypothetical protein
MIVISKQLDVEAAGSLAPSIRSGATAKKSISIAG